MNRTLNLSHEEIERIEEALNYYYASKLELIKNNVRLITEEERKLLVGDANKYAELAHSIDHSEKDV